MKNILLLFAITFPTLMFAQSTDSLNVYRYNLDLNKVDGDKLFVELNTPTCTAEKIEFQMPKIVPGTYAIYDFGRFVSDFQAWDNEGNEMLVKSLTVNRWEIYGAKKLSKITYRIEDTFDTDKSNKIFEPAGTNIEKDENFVLNTFGVFGYLKGMDKLPFEINITKPMGMFGGTALKKGRETSLIDQFLAPNYFELADGPIMYCKPDTIMIPVGNTEVLVSVYSPNGKLKANDIREDVAEIMNAQRKYLGGVLPVDRYAILIYLYSGMSNSGAAGALEHSYSTLFSLPEAGAAELSQTIKDVTAHEFFHIVTPLNAHSEHIHDYDFINPKMSQHLWMYEGVTEYSSVHVQVQYGLFDEDEFLNQIRQKMMVSGFYNDTLPFTKMSKYVLDEYEAQYGNVYQKGALIAMCLDILIRDLSEMKYNLQMLMEDLSSKYHKDTYFEDNQLFEIIEKMTHPEVRAFLEKYVAGSEPLPFKEILERVGITYIANKEEEKVTLGGIRLGMNFETSRYNITSMMNANAFAKKMGFKEYDELVSINGADLYKGENPSDNLKEVLAGLKNGDKLTVVVARKQKGAWKNKKLKGKAQTQKVSDKHVLEFNEDALPEQLSLRDNWMFNK